MTSDSYHTLAGPAEAIYKEKSSKFLAYAYPVESEEEIRTLLDALRKKYYDATHLCYAWRLGPHGETFRDTVVEVEFSYLAMNDVMRVVKEEQPRVLTQQFDDLCRMTLAIRQSLAGGMIGKLEKIGGVTLEMK